MGISAIGNILTVQGCSMIFVASKKSLQACEMTRLRVFFLIYRKLRSRALHVPDGWPLRAGQQAFFSSVWKTRAIATSAPMQPDTPAPRNAYFGIRLPTANHRNTKIH
ncbi:hypothetical protein ACLOJK_029852 [Asimina triloba]